jgi:hypothetical protein
MLGERSAGARRARGSRAARIAGIGVVLLLAATGIIASLVASHPHVTPRGTALPAGRAAPPARVASVQEVGLVSPGPAAAAGGAAGAAAAPAETLLKSGSGLAFALVEQPTPEWTADQMVGGTYIFIYISDGMCLSSAGRGVTGHGAAVLQRCNLGYAQRWRRQEADARGYWQLRNAGDGRCLTLADAVPAAGPGRFRAELAPCGGQQDWRQRVTFSPIY